MRAMTAAWAIVVGAAVVLCAGCAGARNTTADSPTASVADTSSAGSVEQAAPMGSTLTVTSAGATAAYTVANLRPVPPDAQIIPAKGAMYAVDVTIDAQTGTTMFNGFYFVARAADGSTIALAVGAVNPGITSGELPAGQKTDGHVAYDVPIGKAITAVGLRGPKGKMLAVWGVG
jgi:Domain of unknown function (DUF1942)